MYALDLQRYQKLQTIEPSLRLWIRLWLEALHVGTHIHWRFSPFSIAGLAATWRFLSCLDRWGPQQHAIINMAARRREKGSYRGPMPVQGSALGKWGDFFKKQIEENIQVTADALTWHQKWIASSISATPTPRQISANMNELHAVLSLRGFSTDDLFNRVKDGVIDIFDLQGGTARERLVGFLDYFSSAEPRTYIVWTKVVIDTEWSNTTSARFSRIRLEYPWDLRGEGPARVFLPGAKAQYPAIVSRVVGTHSVKERHRLQAIQELDRSMRTGTSFGTLSLDATTQMVLVDQTDRAPWRYSRKPYAIPLFPDDDHSHDGLRVGRVAQELFDYPDRVIDEIFRVFEHSGDGRYWESVPRSYHRLLRTDLGFAVHAYRQRLQGIFRKTHNKDVPPATRFVCDLESIRDFADLIQKMKRANPDEDALFVSRLEEIVRWPHFDPSTPINAKAYNSVHEITDLLTLAKGFRNALAHSQTFPFDVYHVSIYLATVMLYVYSAYKRDKRRTSRTMTSDT